MKHKANKLHLFYFFEIDIVFVIVSFGGNNRLFIALLGIWVGIVLRKIPIAIEIFKHLFAVCASFGRIGFSEQVYEKKYPWQKANTVVDKQTNDKVFNK